MHRVLHYSQTYAKAGAMQTHMRSALLSDDASAVKIFPAEYPQRRNICGFKRSFCTALLPPAAALWRTAAGHPETTSYLLILLFEDIVIVAQQHPFITS